VRAIAHLLTCLAFAAASAAALAQPRYGLSSEAYAVFSKWMTSTCLGQEADALQRALVRHRAELAPAFQRALADGPPPAELAAMRGAADTTYRALATVAVSESRVQGLDPQIVARSTRAPRQAFVDDQVQRYIIGYQSNAVAGLGERLAQQRGNPLAAAAAAAIKAPDR
jgi:hypothetical protein